jgi:nucleoside-diphosphate-sugar epimerase
MKCLVTGGMGFLGRRLVRELLSRGAYVCCLVRPSSNVDMIHPPRQPETESRLEVRKANLSEVGSYEDTLTGCDVVYHLAAELRGAPAVLFMNNVITTRHLLEAATRADVRRFVLVSSLGVYGTYHLRPGDLLEEGCPLDPEPHRRDPYSHSKIAQEEVAWEAHGRGAVSLVVVRPGVIYGPGRDCLSARVGLRFGSLLIRMGGSQQLPYTFVDNCADGVLRAGTTPDVEGRAFNLVDDGLPSGQELLRQYRAVLGRIRSISVPQWAIGPLSGLCEWYHLFSKGQIPAVLTRYRSSAQWKPLRYSNARAKAVLGWPAHVSFAEGIRQTLDWLRLRTANPDLTVN